MRKILAIIIALLATTHSTAQTFDTTTHYGMMNYIFANVNKTVIPTGILADYGIDFADLKQYKGDALTDTNWVTLPDWRLIYNTLYSEQINDNANLLGLDSINNTIAKYATTNLPITFTCLNYNYNYLDSNAVSKNEMTVTNGQIYDVPNRTQNPYLQASAFAIAPSQQGIWEGNNQLILRPELFFTNTGKTISSIQIDPLGTGTYQTVLFNTPLTVNYSTPGAYALEFKITYTDNSVHYGHTKLIAYDTADRSQATTSLSTFKILGSGPPYYRKAFIFGNRQSVPQIFSAQKAYLGSVATGDYTIELSTNNTSGKIKKPLIVLDGFDPYANTSKFPISGFQFSDLMTSYNVDPNNHLPITLNNNLDNVDSFDIVYLHWKNGTDYIERNAYLLERLIQIVDSIKMTNGSTQKNVIIGMSMGGLVARWALRDMEINNMDHQTRLFISHDAPHWGANVPVAFQAMVQYLAPWQMIDAGIKPLHLGYKDMFPEAQFGLDLFNSPAAKEMIIQRYTLSGSTLTADNSAHNTFMTELNNMGWPQLCRNIVLSNGSGNGQLLFPDNSQMFSVTGKESWTYFGQMWRSLALSIGGSIGLNNAIIPNVPINNASASVQFPLSLFSTSTALNLNMGAWAVPRTGTSTLFLMDLYIKRKILWLINSTSHIIKNQVNSTSDMLPLDNAPGGTYNLYAFGFNIDDLNDQLKHSLFSFAKATLLQGNFCFVPTVSALGLSNPTQSLFSPLNSDNIPCQLPQFVSDYHTSSDANQEHISYTQDNTNWLQIEFPSTYQNTTVCLGHLKIIGSNNTCQSTTNYYVSNLPNNATVTWSASPSGIVTLTTSGNAVTLNKIATGTITLNATVNVNGTNYPLSQATTIGSCVVVKNAGAGVIRGGVTFTNSSNQTFVAQFGAPLTSSTLSLLPGQYTLNASLSPGSPPVLIQENGINHPVTSSGAPVSVGSVSVMDGYSVYGISPYYGNSAVSKTFYRNNCPAGQVGTAVAYSIPSNTYYSDLSQIDADTQASDVLNSNGQIYANSTGNCTIPSVVMQNSSDGKIYFKFLQAGVVKYSTLVTSGSSVTTTTIPPGAYTVQMSNAGPGSTHIFTLGYSQTGTSVTFNNVMIGNNILNIYVTNAGSSNFTLFPNPATNQVSIQPSSLNSNNTKMNNNGRTFRQAGNIENSKNSITTKIYIKNVNVYDNRGSLKFTQGFNQQINNVQLNISNLKAGIYFIEIITNIGAEKHELQISL